MTLRSTVGIRAVCVAVVVATFASLCGLATGAPAIALVLFVLAIGIVVATESRHDLTLRSAVGVRAVCVAFVVAAFASLGGVAAMAPAIAIVLLGVDCDEGECEDSCERFHL